MNTPLPFQYFPVSSDSLIVGNTYIIINIRTTINYGPRIFKGIHNDMLGYDAGLGATIWEPILYMMCVSPPPHITPLDIDSAEDIGELTEGQSIVLKDYLDPIAYTPYENGDNCVMIIYPNGNIQANVRCFIYKSVFLKQWFEMNHTSDPQTRIHITQSMIRRFRYCCINDS